MPAATAAAFAGIHNENEFYSHHYLSEIIVDLARHPWAPTVYPTRDAEVAIHFRSPDSPDSVVVLLDNHGGGECYAYTGGHNRRAHYDASSDLPDDFVMEQLRALRPERNGRPRQVDGRATAC